MSTLLLGRPIDVKLRLDICQSFNPSESVLDSSGEGREKAALISTPLQDPFANIIISSGAGTAGNMNTLLEEWQVGVEHAKH